jgi:hypothetical protein
MASINTKCAHCEEITAASVAQSIQTNGVNWSMSYNCSHCNESIEYDDSSPTPQDVREAILNFNGGLLLKLSSDKKSKIQAAKSLSTLFLFSTPNALKIATDIIHKDGIMGTEKEIKWLAENFKKGGVDFCVQDMTYTTYREGEFLDYSEITDSALLVAV